MRASNSILMDEVGKVGQRLGARKPAPMLALPNLPNLPNLFSHTRTRTHVHTRAHTHARSRAHTHNTFTLGRLGRLGRTRRGAALSLPNLCLTFPTSQKGRAA
jgi:hypothetical protein